MSSIKRIANLSTRFHLLLALLCSILPLPATGAPRDTVQQVATLIENNYFDATKAQEIARDLRESAQAGRFDTLRDPRDLATALTGRLQPLDHHFRVTWSAPESPSSAAPNPPGGDPVMSLETLERRNAYGFRRVDMLPGAIGYLDLRLFADFSFDKPDEPARKAADAALALVSTADAVIIDLRNNAGGSSLMVGYLVSAFTAPGADIYNVFRSRDGTSSERPKESYSRPRLAVPLYVLISGRTASAAESTAYTLQAAKRAVVVGEVSGGAANPGGEFPAADGFSIFISTSTTVNAVTGTNWEGVGVKPDVAVNPEHALERAQILALESVLRNNPTGTEAVETRWVLEALRAEASPAVGPPITDYVGAYAGAEISAENGHLALRRDRRPAWALTRVRGDVFCVTDEPFRRVLFERNTAHGVTRFQLTRAGGPSTWFPKASGHQSPVGVH